MYEVECATRVRPYRQSRGKMTRNITDEIIDEIRYNGDTILYAAAVVTSTLLIIIGALLLTIGYLGRRYRRLDRQLQNFFR